MSINCKEGAQAYAPLVRLQSLLLICSVCFTASLVAHSGGVNSNGCHTPGGQGSGNPCHCHNGSDRSTELACSNGQPLSNNEDDDEDAAIETFLGLVVEPEDECVDYESDMYAYGSDADLAISREMGAIYGPYENQCFDDLRDVDVEHIVARKEAHDSGLCSASHATRLMFASDIDNLTLASPNVNRSQKSDKDSADWLPDFNRCWYTNQIVHVKRKYGLSIDSAERDALREVLSVCTVTETELKVPLDCINAGTP